MDIIRRVLEPWIPYDQSVQWRIHHAYYAAWNAWSSNIVPSLGTSSELEAEQQARVIVEIVRSLIHEGRVAEGEPVDILEIGCGAVRFAIELHCALDRTLGEWPPLPDPARSLHTLRCTRFAVLSPEARKILSALRLEAPPRVRCWASGAVRAVANGKT